MFEVREDRENIGGKDITVYSRDVYNHNILTVSAGSTGPRDRETVSYIEFRDNGGTNFSVDVERCPLGDVEKIGITFYQEAELETLIRGLKFITKTLEDAYYEVND